MHMDGSPRIAGPTQVSCRILSLDKSVKWARPLPALDLTTTDYWHGSIAGNSFGANRLASLLVVSAPS